MSDSRTVDHLGERIADALAERRVQPSSDFEARLERASQPARPSRVTGVLAIAATACAMLVVVVTQPERAPVPAPIERPERAAGQPPPSQPPAPVLPHDGKYTANECGQCHRSAPPSPPAAHEPKGSFPLVGGHRMVPCARCHTPNKRPQRDCSSCHTPGSSKVKP